jgi:glycosyltransferase involved in cell wall biosynthesis
LVGFVTINLNNSPGLFKTLESLCDLEIKPFEVIIIDGGSSDTSISVIEKFSYYLPIKFISEPDAGIYDAMNKGLAWACGDLIHYLNSGDYVYGEPYLNLYNHSLLPVKIHDANDRFIKFANINLFGYAYCHQGIIYQNPHCKYSLEFKIASDFKLTIYNFNSGLTSLQMSNTGGVCFNNDGVSSRSRIKREIEIILIILNKHDAKLFLLYIFEKTLNIIKKGLG